MLRLTGFKTYRELMTETTPEQRRLLVRSIEQWQRKRSSGSSAGGLGGL